VLIIKTIIRFCYLSNILYSFSGLKKLRRAQDYTANVLRKKLKLQTKEKRYDKCTFNGMRADCVYLFYIQSVPAHPVQ